MFSYPLFHVFVSVCFSFPVPLPLRSFLQNRLRAPHDRTHWRGSSMCWIRGSLYRVSANKLSRTPASNMSINRTGTPTLSVMLFDNSFSTFFYASPMFFSMKNGYYRTVIVYSLCRDILNTYQEKTYFMSLHIKFVRRPQRQHGFKSFVLIHAFLVNVNRSSKG